MKWVIAAIAAVAVATAVAWIVLFTLRDGCATPRFDLPPFRRGEIDDRDPRRVGIRAVADDGTFELADGRRVRPFGIDAPVDAAGREAFLEAARRFVGEEASVRPVLDGSPPAVELRAWVNWVGCGNTFQTWNPFDPPIRSWVTTDVATELANYAGATARRTDLDAPTVPGDVRIMRFIFW